MKTILALFLLIAFTQVSIANENDWDQHQLKGRPSAMTVKTYKTIQRGNRIDKELKKVKEFTYNGQGYLKTEIKTNSDGDTTVHKVFSHHKRGYSLGFKSLIETKYDHETASVSYNYSNRLYELQIVKLNSKGDTLSVEYKTYDFTNKIKSSAYLIKGIELSDKVQYDYDEKGRLVLEIHKNNDGVKNKFVWEFKSVTTYDLIVFDGSGKEQGRTSFTVDQFENVIQEMYMARDREFKTTYEYEYDDQNNWIKSTRTTNGEIKEEIERTITYY